MRFSETSDMPLLPVTMPDVLIMLLHKIYCNKRKIFLFQYCNKCIILAYTLKDCKKKSIYETLLAQ